VVSVREKTLEIEQQNGRLETGRCQEESVIQMIENEFVFPLALLHRSSGDESIERRGLASGVGGVDGALPERAEARAAVVVRPDAVRVRVGEGFQLRGWSHSVKRHQVTEEDALE